MRRHTCRRLNALPFPLPLRPEKPQQGVCSPATGPFADGAAAGDASELFRLAAPFFEARAEADDSGADGLPASCEFAGARLVVVHRAPGAYCAVSRRRDVGVAARHLAGGGVLLASFARPTPAQRVVCELDRCCAALQA